MWGVALGAIAIAVVGGMLVAIRGGGNGETKVFAEVDGVKCESGERLEFHIHATLVLVINGEQVPVPQSIGVRTNECIFWLHTHDASGLMHIEAPSKRDLTLGQFFAVWGQPLSTTQLLDQTVDGTHEIVATVNGEPAEGDPANIVMNDQDTIVVQYTTR